MTDPIGARGAPSMTVTQALAGSSGSGIDRTERDRRDGQRHVPEAARRPAEVPGPEQAGRHHGDDGPDGAVPDGREAAASSPTRTPRCSASSRPPAPSRSWAAASPTPRGTRRSTASWTPCGSPPVGRSSRSARRRCRCPPSVEITSASSARHSPADAGPPLPQRNPDMLRSLFSAVSGLRSHQTMMDVVGNNIANVNTAGFKSSSTVFEDTLSQVVRAGGGPQGLRGGTNPAQVGLGVRVGGITTNFGQGNTQVTGRATDVALQGDGFFVVKQDGQTLYSRAGAFSFDPSGQLVNPDGADRPGLGGHRRPGEHQRPRRRAEAARSARPSRPGRPPTSTPAATCRQRRPWARSPPARSTSTTARARPCPRR